jgi:hypothetical protein
MNKDVMPSIEILDALVKEKKVKTSLLLSGERRSHDLHK